MSSLVERVDQVAKLARLVLRWSTLLRAIAAVLTAMVLVGFVDWLSSGISPIIRWGLSLSLVAVVGFVLARWVIPAMRAKFERIAVSRKIESRFPELRELLSTAVALYLDSSSTSTPITSAILRDAQQNAQHCALTEAVDRRPLWHSTLQLSLALLAMAMVILASPTSSWIAANRLIMPWSNTRYPTQHQLAWVVAPTILARGETLELELLDRAGPLPDEVVLELRYERDPTRIQSRVMKPRGDRMVDRLDGIAESLSYRARGGDDQSMEWTMLRVVEPPRLSNILLTITPPKYTRLPIATSSRLATVREGSQIEIRADVDQPVRGAMLKGTPTPKTVLTVVENGEAIATDPSHPWVATESGSFPIELSTDDDVELPTLARIELKVIPDQPPTVTIRDLSDSKFCTVHARIPIHAIVKDDLGIQNVELRYGPWLRGVFTPTAKLLYDGGKEVSLEVANAGGQQLELQDWIDLETISGLAPGARVDVNVLARDYGGHPSVSPEFSVAVVTEDEFASRIMERQAAILNQLSDALKLFRQSRDQTTSVITQLRQTESAEAAAIETLRRAELNHRLAEQLLIDPSEGAERLIQQCTEDLAQNRLEKSPIYAPLATLYDQIGSLRQTELVAIRREITNALKQVTSKSPPPSAARKREEDLTCDPSSDSPIVSSLTTAEQAQNNLIAQLESMLGTLTQSDTFGKLIRELVQIHDSQKQIHQKLDELRISRIIATNNQAATGDSATVAWVVTREQELARGMEKWQLRCEDLAARTAESDGRTSQLLREGLEIASQSAIAPMMRRIASELTSERVQESVVLALQTRDTLARILEILQGKPTEALQDNLSALEESASKLTEHASKVAEQLQRHEEAAASTDPDAQQKTLDELGNAKGPLAAEGDDLAESLQASGSPAAAELASASSAALREAEKQRTSAENSLAEVRRAAEQLSAAMRQLKREIQSGQQQLLQQQLGKIEEMLAKLLEQQMIVSNWILESEDARRENPAVKDPKSLADFAANQQRENALQLAATAQLFAEGLPMRVVAQATSTEMRDFASRLDQEQTGPDSQATSSRFATTIKTLMDAVRTASTTPPPATSGENTPSNGTPKQQLSASEIKLLAMLQQAIAEQTTALEKRREQGELSEVDLARLDELAREQEELIGLVERILEPTNATEPAKDGDTTTQQPPDPTNNLGPLDSLESELLKDIPTPGGAK